MKVLIIGAGRMGIRHAQGVAKVDFVSSIVLADIKLNALESAKETLRDARFSFCTINSLLESFEDGFDICIVATTAENRLEVLKMAFKLKSKEILLEKPLGQSMRQVLDLSDFIEQNKIRCSVNLNMRLYDNFTKLKSDFRLIQQLKGEKTISINTGTLGIGANGIHYLDLLYFIFDANRADLIAGEIDDNLIPSGRGEQFSDFGGWAVIKFFDNEIYLGKVLLSMSANSTVFGSWEIVAPHGRIHINEVEGKRIETFRKLDSKMPMNRYYADYQAPVESSLDIFSLSDITEKWIRRLHAGVNYLPSVKESIPVHELLFSWLGKSKSHKEIFPIT